MARADTTVVQNFIGGMGYPANKDDIISYAREHGADDKVMKTLMRLPGNLYTTPTELSKDLDMME